MTKNFDYTDCSWFLFRVNRITVRLKKEKQKSGLPRVNCCSKRDSPALNEDYTGAQKL